MTSKYITLLLSTFIVILAALNGCAPSKTTLVEEVTPPTVSDVKPVDLTVIPDDQGMTVEWKRKGDGLISGYNIYISDNQQISDSAKPFNFEPYPGDTNPDDGVETFKAEGLENGKRYFVSVKVIRPDRSLSPSSNQASTICGPRGEIVIESRYSGEHDGYAFAANQYVRAFAKSNDLYFYSTNGFDYLASPSRLDGFNRRSLFSKLSVNGSLSEIRTAVSKLKVNPDSERAELKAGDWILIRTADNHNGLLKVLGFEGEGKARAVRLEFAFCPAEGEMVF